MIPEIQVEFVELTEIPVPVSRDEIFFIRNQFGDVRAKQAIGWASRFMFDAEIEPNYTYYHLKFTAKPKTKFKAGDRVIYKPHDCEYTVSTVMDTKNKCTLTHDVFKGLILAEYSELELITDTNEQL